MGGDRSVDVDRRQQSEDVGLQDSHEGFKQDEYQAQPQGDHTQPLNPAAGLKEQGVGGQEAQG